MSALRIAELHRDLAALHMRLAEAYAESEPSAPASTPRGPYHQGNLPPGETSRSYLDKARACAFKTSKTGRSVLCVPDDWDAYVASKQRHPRKVEAPPANDIRAEAEAALNEIEDRRLRKRAGAR